MFTMCYTRSSIIDISLFRKSELRDEGGNKMGKIMAVNISEKKGTQKKNVHSARLVRVLIQQFLKTIVVQFVFEFVG